MPSAVSLATIRGRIRTRAELLDLWPTADLNTEINASIAEWYRKVLRRARHRFLTSSNVAVTAGTSDYDLASALPLLWEVVAVDVVDASQPSGYSQMQRYNLDERHRVQYTARHLRECRYELRGDNLRLYPAPPAGTIRLGYVQTAPSLGSDGATFDTLNRLEEWVVVDCMIKGMRKRREDTSYEERRRDALMTDFLFDLQPDRARPRVITDAQGWWGRGRYGRGTLP